MRPMTYGRVRLASQEPSFDGAVVSHSAELVRGTSIRGGESPLIRPFGAPSPQGEKGPRGACGRITSIDGVSVQTPIADWIHQ